MNGYLRMIFVASAVAAASLGAGKTGPEQALHVRVYDQAPIPAGTLKRALSEAGRIFDAAGIKITWDLPVAESPKDRGLDESEPAAPRTRPERPYIAVRIVKSMPAAIFPSALGFALPFAQTGAHVSIFYDRIASTAGSWNVASYVALGCAIAHEIGHVLLRSSEHSSGGLMQARWNHASWQLAPHGLLAFSAKEKREMRDQLSRFGAPVNFRERELIADSGARRGRGH